jgi:two-component system response regulator (stage 0 sporulation protein F)
MPKLMVVDDEADVREYLKNYFKRRKIDVVTAESGEEALILLEKGPAPDLILLDIRMTGIDGIETLRRMKEAGKELKVIMVTGVEDQKVLQKLSEFNVLTCVHKPLMLDELEKEVMQRIIVDA